MVGEIRLSSKLLSKRQNMSNELIIAAYGSHNAAVAMYYKGTYRVIEVERWLSKKNAGLINYLPSGYPKIIFDEIMEYLLSLTDRSDVDLYLTNYADTNKMKPGFNYKQYNRFDHHEAHAATAFYQSPYEDAITFTFDGGGDLGFFNVYRTDRRGGVKLLERFSQDLGFAYMILGDHLTDIKRDPLNIGNLVYAGKLMGLCSYGNVREDWFEAFTEFYETFNYQGDSYLGGGEAAVDALPKLMKAIGVDDFNQKTTRLEGQLAWDIAATTQEIFEQQFFKFAQPYLDRYPDLPVTMSGGCALNVILNTKLLHLRDGKVFVPPNTSDCGVAVGGILLNLKPEQQVDLTYCGAPILDSHMFSSYIENDPFSVVEDVTVADLAKFISLGNIVGVIRGNSEHGPRALGNRSIICNPIGDMKDVLNAKVKNREWYRPFAPVVRLEDATKYFDFPEGAQSRHMTFTAEFREEYKEKLPAVVHVDGTGRIQTVTRQQNEFLYDLLTEFDKISDHGVLLNTSFNVDKKPILTRLSEALHILKTSEMDAVYYDGKLVFRKGDEKKYEQHIVSENIVPLDTGTTVYLVITTTDIDEVNGKYIPMVEDVLVAQKNVVVVAPPKTIGVFESTIGNKAKYYTLTDNMLYYHEMMTTKVGLEMNHEAFEPYIRMLWAKNVMYENIYRTNNHMFVTLGKIVDPDRIGSDIKMVISLAGQSDNLVVKGGPYVGVFDDNENTKLINGGEAVPSEVPQLDIVWGNMDQIEWLSVNIEGHMLAFIRDGVASSSDVDYSIIPFMSAPERFKVY